MTKTTFGKRLKELRVEKKMTQVELADELRIDKSTIAKYETDKIEPSVPVLLLVVEYFKVSADYLLGLVD